jgi:hypothetical protein
LDPVVFPNAAELKQANCLGPLSVTNTLGDSDNDGDIDRLYAFGTRSFTIFRVTRKGLEPVYDSGTQFGRILSATLPEDRAGPADNPEPEGVALGEIGGRTFAFIGLERAGGIMVYDITVPHHPDFVQYVNNRDFNADPQTPEAGDIAPEGIVFIPAESSPDGAPMLAVSNEYSGTTTLYRIEGPACP